MRAAELLSLFAESDSASQLSEEAWVRVVEQADESRLETLLAERFASLMPTSVAERLSQKTMELTLENVARCHQLVEVLEYLEAQGVRALAYKGPTLAVLAHGSSTLRSFDDLDLWVPPRQYAAATQVLCQAGYKFAVQSVPKCHLIQAFETTLIHPKRRVSIDLHRSFLPPATPVKDSALVEHTQEVSILGHQVKTLSNEALLVLLLAHGSKHAWREVRWIYDVHCLTENQVLDWSRVYELSLECECHLACQVGLHLVEALMLKDRVSELFWPTGRAKQLAERSLGFLARSRPTLKELQSYHWSLCPTVHSKARYLFHTLIAPHELDLAWVDLPKEFYWLYYLLRPLRKAGSLLSRENHF